MTTQLTTRAATAQDVAAMADIASATLFPGDLLNAMIAPFLAGEAGALWQVGLIEDRVAGFAFAETEPMTDRVWNLKAICAAPEKQGLGLGFALLRAVEMELTDQARLIVIDTTQLDDHAAGRGLYLKCGYSHVATLPDFWEDGADKVTFVKHLG